MFRLLPIVLLLSFFWVSPAYADDSDDGFLSQAWETVTAYFSDDDEDDDTDHDRDEDEDRDEEASSEQDDDQSEDDQPVASNATGGVAPTVADITPPVLSLQQAAITVEASSTQELVNLGMVTAADGVDGVIIPSNNAPLTFPLGITPVIWTATDAAGNIITVTQNVVVQDTTPPVMTPPLAITMDSVTGQPMPVTIGTATATDAFTPIAISNNAPTIFPMGNTTVIWTAVDANGNTSTAIQTVTINDTSILANLPPDPGAAGKATLAGIDSDNDGVRDDVQRWIAINYPNSEKTRTALSQYATASLNFILSSTDANAAYDYSVQMGRSSDCLSFVQPSNWYDISVGLEAAILDTALRSRTYLQANHLLSGKGFKLLDNEKQGCDFNPDLMAN